MASTSFALRESTESDIEAIFRIRRHPMVAPSQYPFLADDTPGRWAEQMNSINLGPFSAFRSSTILVEEQVVGHVIQREEIHGDAVFYQCGFNIHPDFWGQGIMTAALPMVLDQLFGEYNASLVVCDCFSDNLRCHRLLIKIGFLPMSIPVYHRIRTAFATRCLRWIKRYRMLPDEWYKTDGLRKSENAG